MSLRLSGMYMNIGEACRAQIVGRAGETMQQHLEGGLSGPVTNGSPPGISPAGSTLPRL